jgi:hypothetical protein
VRRRGASTLEETTTMAYRLIAATLSAAAFVLCAPAAEATLVYVKRPSSLHPQVWAARDGGGHRHRLGTGTRPTVTADGAYVAWRTYGRRDQVLLAPARGGTPRRVVRARQIGDIAFSPDGKRLAVALRRRLALYDVATRGEVASVRTYVRGLSFSPDSTALAYGAGTAEDPATASDLGILTLATGARTLITHDGRSLNPVWGAGGIVFDRATPRRNDAPVYQLWAVMPDGSGARQITRLRVPPLLLGLVPLELSADGRRLLALFEGQDTAVGFAVDPATGRTRSLSRKSESGFVAADLSADGSSALGTRGGPDPSVRHDVVTVPYAGGRPTVLVPNATDPDWSR